MMKYIGAMPIYVQQASNGLTPLTANPKTNIVMATRKAIANANRKQTVGSMKSRSLKSSQIEKLES